MKQTIILRKRAYPIIVNLPDGRSFTSKWERIKRKQLPMNIKVRRDRTISARRNNRRILINQAAPALKKIRAKRKKARQSGKGLAFNLAKVYLELGSKALGPEFSKN